MINPLNPKPAPPAFGQGKIVPEVRASFLSKVSFSWLTPFLYVGYTRPLEHDDLWEFPDDRKTSQMTERFESHFYARCPEEKRPLHMREKVAESSRSMESDTDASSTLEEKQKSDEPAAATTKPIKAKKHDESLPKALFFTFQNAILWAGLFKFVAEMLATTSPMVTRVFLNWLTASYTFHRFNEQEREAAIAGGFNPPQAIGYGIGLSFALFIMQETSSLSRTYYMMTSMTVGMYTRTAMIGNIFRKSLRLSGKARLEHSVGNITTMISTDCSRMDRFMSMSHNLWVAPIQLAVGIGLLIGTLGYSALVGLGVMILSFPLQFLAVKIMLKQRQKGISITDSRMRLTTEVLQGIRLVKYFSWEEFYSYHISDLRRREIATIKKAAIARGGLFALITFIPITASTLSFITYALSGHDLNVAIIFTSVQLFNVIRGPLIMLPLVLGSLAESLIAFRRIGTFMKADELAEPPAVEEASEFAVQIDADFTWEAVEKTESKFKSGDKKKAKSGKTTPELPTTVSDDEKGGTETPKTETPFELKDLKITVPKGSFVAIVGKVGSGKSSVLQAMIGEMRKTRGEVKLGGSIAYVPQTAWIKNLTLRDNVTFGQADDEERFQQIVKACSLERDIEMLPQNENTEIGEKGINLSGGQKARVSLARAAYSYNDIILMDDCLSAVDAYVGKAILENCILSGPLASRTRVLVTHALHVLDKADYIYVVDNATVAEEGTYKDLTSRPSKLSALLEEYGSLEDIDEKEEAKEANKPAADAVVKEVSKASNTLMQEEDRNTGAVSASVYNQYIRHAGGYLWLPVILLVIISLQGANVGGNLILSFWTGAETGGGLKGFDQGKYIGVYAALGIAQSLLTFLMAVLWFFMTLAASLSLFKSALSHVLGSPVSLFDTTPIGRILSRFSRDQDIMDDDLPMMSFQFTFTFSSVGGTVFLVFWVFPYLGIIFAPMTFLYISFFLFYRRTSVETKRLDSVLRSKLYASYSESLTGLSTIRAYGIQNEAIISAETGLDWQNKAYYLTIGIQRWLSVRLDLFANTLVLGIALFAVGFRHTINPSQIGVVLTYTLGVMMLFSDMVSQFAQTEQNMNAAERLLEYTTLPAEGDRTTPNDPPEEWPQKGKIEFQNVDLAYRKNLPLVLKNVSFDIKEGEKVGIVGRTGAGKSSLLQALFRMVEVQSGKIVIDGVDISKIGLSALRTKLALVPQDSTLFLGTLRENLDPLRLRTDAELVSVLQRAWLLPADGSSDPVAEAKFSLDATVGDEGSNFSAGEKQLLALARALAKNSRIIVLDEATSSVDVETDAKLQRTIQTEFEGSSLLCIAHRLNTIAYYDRVLVMDAGEVAEFDTVLNLFDREDSIFRSLCDEAKLSRADIVKIRDQNKAIVSGQLSSQEDLAVVSS